MNTEVMMSNATADLEQVRKAVEVFNQKHEFKPGDIVQWKPGMKNMAGNPEYGEPALVVEVLAEPVYDNNHSNGTPYFNEPRDLVLAEISKRDGELLLYHFDSRRFEPYKPVEPGKE